MTRKHTERERRLLECAKHWQGVADDLSSKLSAAQEEVAQLHSAAERVDTELTCLRNSCHQFERECAQAKAELRREKAIVDRLVLR